MFSLFKKRTFFSPEEQRLIVQAIQRAERNTSGEVRVHVESRCSYMDALDRAVELFAEMGMQATVERNGVLVYVAVKDHQLAVFGDEGHP
jgi:Predicted membrane protein